MNFLMFVAKNDNYIMPLTHIINESSLREGVFLSELKLATVVPIFKAGATNKITNYRSGFSIRAPVVYQLYE